MLEKKITRGLQINTFPPCTMHISSNDFKRVSRRAPLPLPAPRSPRAGELLHFGQLTDQQRKKLSAQLLRERVEVSSVRKEGETLWGDGGKWGRGL